MYVMFQKMAKNKQNNSEKLTEKQASTAMFE